MQRTQRRHNKNRDGIIMEDEDLEASRPLESWSDYQLTECIGTGAYSTVWQAKHIPSGTMVAIKLEEVVFADIINCKRVLREIKLLRQLSHPNIVKLLDLFMSPDKDPNKAEIYLVLELIDTDLKQLIKAPSYRTEKQIKTLFYGILLGMKYLQSAGVLHRDIKPANILVTKYCQPKICDFGLARTMLEISPPPLYEGKKKSKDPAAMCAPPVEFEYDHETEVKKVKLHPIELEKRLTAHVVTRWYRAPEVVLMQKDYGYGIDVWAAGCLFAELQAMKKENVARSQDRRPLFPGTACNPLSPKSEKEAENNDQLNVILEVIGTPTAADCGFISEKEVVEKLLSLPKKPKKNYSELYPGSEKPAIDLLDKMLQFDPYKRITVDECLAHPYLASVRKKELEISAAEKIVMEFAGTEEGLDAAAIHKTFIEEMEHFDKRRKEGGLFK